MEEMRFYNLGITVLDETTGDLIPFMLHIQVPMQESNATIEEFVRECMEKEQEQPHEYMEDILQWIETECVKRFGGEETFISIPASTIQFKGKQPDPLTFFTGDGDIYTEEDILKKN